MIVWFVLILSIVWIALATALYSNFLPYFSLLSDIRNYNMAYYGANSAIERSFLVLRYQEAWFQWSWWWNKTISFGPESDKLSNELFGYYTNSTKLYWSILGRSDWNSIPWIWKWNIDSYLLSWASNDWNMLNYRSPQRIPLWVDTTTSQNAYVSWWVNERDYFNWRDISLNLQLIPSVKDLFSNQSDPHLWKLQTSNDWDWDWVGDDIIVDRWRKGLYDSRNFQFSIIPRSLVWILSWSDDIIVEDEDESIRESIINRLSDYQSVPPISFAGNINLLYTPGDPNSLRNWERETHLMISDDSTEANSIGQRTFNEILADWHITDQEINLFLTKKLLSESNWIYPFLQYNLRFDWDPNIAQPYFSINWKSQIWQYTVQMNVKKPVNKDETLWSFTVVF